METRTVLRVVAFAVVILAVVGAALFLTEPSNPLGTSSGSSAGGGPTIQWRSDSIAR